MCPFRKPHLVDLSVLTHTKRCCLFAVSLPWFPLCLLLPLVWRTKHWWEAVYRKENEWKIALVNDWTQRLSEVFTPFKLFKIWAHMLGKSFACCEAEMVSKGDSFQYIANKICYLCICPHWLQHFLQVLLLSATAAILFPATGINSS